jgi:hypothetical protein
VEAVLHVLEINLAILLVRESEYFASTILNQVTSNYEGLLKARTIHTPDPVDNY